MITIWCQRFCVFYFVYSILCSLFCVISKMGCISFAFEYWSKVFRLASLAPSPAGPPAHPSAKHNFKNGQHFLCFSILIQSIWNSKNKHSYNTFPFGKSGPSARRLPAHPSAKQNLKKSGRFLCFSILSESIWNSKNKQSYNIFSSA